MGYYPSELSVLAYANEFTLWHYKARAHSVDMVTKRGYFDSGADMLKEDDKIIVSSKDACYDLRIKCTDGGVVAVVVSSIIV